MGARGPGTTLPPSHCSARPEGPGQTYRSPKLVRNSFSARKLPACYPAAPSTRPAPCPARRPSASGCFRLRLQQLVLTVQRPQGRSDCRSQRRGDPSPPPCVLYLRPFPGCCTAGNGDRRRAACSEIPLATRPLPAPTRELWPVVTCYPA